jgi:hypothetical protein
LVGTAGPAAGGALCFGPAPVAGAEAGREAELAAEDEPDGPAAAVESLPPPVHPARAAAAATTSIAPPARISRPYIYNSLRIGSDK